MPIRSARGAIEPHDGASRVPTATAPAPVSLDQLPRGATCRVQGSTLDSADAALLRAMGLRPDASVRVCRLGEPCIVSVKGECGPACRIGLSRHLARRVLVSPAS